MKPSARGRAIEALPRAGDGTAGGAALGFRAAAAGEFCGIGDTGTAARGIGIAGIAEAAV